jgi:hypothetical protein
MAEPEPSALNYGAGGVPATLLARQICWTYKKGESLIDADPRRFAREHAGRSGGID